jgi:hypothetical protein
MTSAPTQPARSAGGRHAQGRGYGLALFAPVLLAGGQLARWFAVAVLGLNVIGQMLFTPAYPAWSLMIIAVDAVALSGLCACGSRANLEPA